MAALLRAAEAADEIERLREELDAEREARRAIERRLAGVEARERAHLDTAVREYLARDAAQAEGASPSGLGGIIDLSAMLDLQVGTSTAGDESLPEINRGDHDPRKRGFNVRNEELVVSADVDPYFYALLDVVFKIDEEGESALELEEAFALSTGLPAGLQLKIGQFFTEFGRGNALHPHAWEFLAAPVILARAFGGDGWRGQGLRISWLVPGAPVTLLAGVQNARGETQAAFLGEAGEEVGDHLQLPRAVDSLDDFAYHLRAEASHDFERGPGEAVSLLAGISAGFGPNGTGPGAGTAVYGVDLLLKWRPAATDGGWPYVAWQTEFLLRDFDAAAQILDDGSGGTVAVSARAYRDWGAYTQVVWAFRRPFTAGVRLDYADTDGAFADDQTRVSVALSCYTSEFARIRLQGNWDRHRGDDVFSIWLGFSFALGKHGAHTF